MRHSTKLRSGYRHRELRLNCGSGAQQVYTDPFGLAWVSDNAFISTGVVVSDQPIATRTAYPNLFQSLRYNPGGFTYDLMLDNGIFELNCFWSETFFTTVGQKVFGLAIQGKTVLQNFDIIREAGGQNIAISRLFKTYVTNRHLKIDFLPGSADHPSISAMCVTRIASLRR